MYPFTQTIVKVSGYDFSTWKIKEIEIKDSLSYEWVKQRIDSMKLYTDVSCRFPDVRMQIIIIDGENYDILSSDFFSAMEKNGRCVVFDKTLQEKINRVIEIQEKNNKYFKDIPNR
jgi:hypothetical protein